MKTSLPLFLAAAGLALATEPAQPADTKPCCAVLPSSAPLAERSLYQLEAGWTNDAGEATALVALRGHPVVLAMFFASCEYACPILVNDIQRLRAQLPAGAREHTRFVLVTFDTIRDTPAALAAYRKRLALDDQWTLLHGSKDSVQELAMLLGVKFKQDARGQFAHSNIITMLNPEGEIVQQITGLNSDVSEAARTIAKMVPPPVAAR